MTQDKYKMMVCYNMFPIRRKRCPYKKYNSETLPYEVKISFVPSKSMVQSPTSCRRIIFNSDEKKNNFTEI